MEVAVQQLLEHTVLSREVFQKPLSKLLKQFCSVQISRFMPVTLGLFR